MRIDNIEQYIVYAPFPLLNSHRISLGLAVCIDYKKGNKEISLLYPNTFTMDCYEIYCISGDLFDGIERYETLGEAEARIMELLNEGGAK